MAKHNENRLSLIWDKRQKDFVVKYPRRCDGNLALNTLISERLIWDINKWMNRNKVDAPQFKSESFKDELESRGYDLSTLRFSIELKK